MILFLSAQDISFLEVGLLEENGRLFSFQKIESTPENFLFNLSNFLNNLQFSFEKIKKIVVVVGPGSFTSTRMIVTIANALSFSRSLPIIGVKNSDRKNGEELISLFGQDWSSEEAKNFTCPFYDRPPNITIKPQSS